MDSKKTLILIKNEDKTESISKCSFSNDKCLITFTSGSSYEYKAYNVKEMILIEKLSTESYSASIDGCIISGVKEILNFGDYIKLIYNSNNSSVFKKEAIALIPHVISDKQAKSCLSFLKK